jgi:hypothetical protein
VPTERHRAGRAAPADLQPAGCDELTWREAIADYEHARASARANLPPMPAGPTDWRQTGQERWLPRGTTFARRPYRALDDAHEHDHCEFCWAKFLDPSFSDAPRRMLEEDPSAVAEGYVAVGTEPQGADDHWVCATCFGDFATELGWVIVSSLSADGTWDERFPE